MDYYHNVYWDIRLKDEELDNDWLNNAIDNMCIINFSPKDDIVVYDKWKVDGKILTTITQKGNFDSNLGNDLLIALEYVNLVYFDGNEFWFNYSGSWLCLSDAVKYTNSTYNSK